MWEILLWCVDVFRWTYVRALVDNRLTLALQTDSILNDESASHVPMLPASSVNAQTLSDRMERGYQFTGLWALTPARREQARADGARVDPSSSRRPGSVPERSWPCSRLSKALKSFSHNAVWRLSVSGWDISYCAGSFIILSLQRRRIKTERFFIIIEVWNRISPRKQTSGKFLKELFVVSWTISITGSKHMIYDPHFHFFCVYSAVDTIYLKWAIKPLDSLLRGEIAQLSSIAFSRYVCAGEERN